MWTARALGRAALIRIQAWEFKHPDFKMNNKDALDNIRRKAPAPRKPNAITDDMIPTQQMDLVNTQLIATQQQLQQLQERYNVLNMQHSKVVEEVIAVSRTVQHHDHVMQHVMSFLNTADAQRRRESRSGGPFAGTNGQPNGTNMGDQDGSQLENEAPASPLQHANKLMGEINVDSVLGSGQLEQITEQQMRMNAALTTPPPDRMHLGSTRSSSRGPQPHSATSSTSQSYGELDTMVYPIGQTQGIDPMYSEHINNIPYPMPPKAPDGQLAPVPEMRKKSMIMDPGWIRQPQILLVEDDNTCRRIGGKFLYAFHCAVDNAVSSEVPVCKGKLFSLTLH